MIIFSSSMKYRFKEKLMLTNSISIYIRAIINKMNIWYSIIKIIKKKTKKKIIEMINKMIKNLENE